MDQDQINTIITVTAVLLPHVRAFLPNQYQGFYGAFLQIFDVIVGNYRNAKNKTGVKK